MVYVDPCEYVVYVDPCEYVVSKCVWGGAKDFLKFQGKTEIRCKPIPG